MLADPEDVDADLIGKFHLLEKVLHAPVRTDGNTRRRVGAHARKCIDTNVPFRYLVQTLPVR